MSTPPTVPPPAADATTTRPLRFVHRGRIAEVAGLPATTSVLGWLRDEAHCTGTKEGCNEGDCGACTVLVGTLGADGQSVDWAPVNSCLRPLPTLDGHALLTVEDLADDPTHLHPVQQALVDCHGSQCGFCTPGFVMSLAACAERHARSGGRPTRRQIADDLSGNLCRCTGYRPILDAGERLFADGTPPHLSTALPAALTAATAEALRSLAADPPLHYAGAPGLHAPRTVEAMAALLATKPQARILAGATDIGLWINKQFRPLGELVYVGEVAALKQVRIDDGQLEIGAAVSLQDAWTALGAYWPTLTEMGLRFASRPVREAGTLAGNLANGSPIGDGAPVLMALAATLVLQHGTQRRTLALDDFYLDYMKNRLAPGEFIAAVRVPLPAAGDIVRAYKLSKRFDSDISSVAAGAWLRLTDDGRVADLRLAFGGLAATVKRAGAAEAALRGQPWTEATLRAAQDQLDAEFRPLTDLRASAAYRRRGARALLEKLWLETRPAAPLAPTELSVWSTR